MASHFLLDSSHNATPLTIARAVLVATALRLLHFIFIRSLVTTVPRSSLRLRCILAATMFEEENSSAHAAAAAAAVPRKRGETEMRVLKYKLNNLGTKSQTIHTHTHTQRLQVATAASGMHLRVECWTHPLLSPVVVCVLQPRVVAMY